MIIKNGFVKNRAPCHKYIPDTLLESEKYKVHLYREVRTNKMVQSKRLGIICFNKGTKEAYIIDTAIPNSPNIM
jgi:hypothetical protein